MPHSFLNQLSSKLMAAVSLPIRELCRTIGESASAKIQQLLMAQRIEARTGPIADPTALNSESFIGSSSSSEILGLVDADCAYLSCADKSAVIGFLDPYDEALAVVSYLQSCHFTSIQRSHNLRKDFPGLAHVGLAAIGLSLLCTSKHTGADIYDRWTAIHSFARKRYR